MSVLTVPRGLSARSIGRLGRLGAASAPPGFDQLLNGVGAPVQQAWGSVQQQLSAENAPQGVIYNAQQNFLDAYTGLSQANPATSINDLVNLANAAGNLSLSNNTILAVGSLMDGVIQGAISGNAPEVVQAIGGTLAAVAGAAIAAGSVSFGIGAAIVVGISLGTAAIDGLFNTTPPVATVCGYNLGYKPGIVVNCAWTQGIPQQSGTGTIGNGVAGQPATNPFWRSFPEPSNAADAWWFTPGPVVNGIQQPRSIFGLYDPNQPSNGTLGGQWQSGKSNDTWFASQLGQRPIDAAFPQYHQLECDVNAAIAVASLPDSGGTVVAGVSQGTYGADDVQFARFILAYFGAWKSNAEFVLNGMAPKYADDSTVLGHVIGYWNGSHQQGATRTLTPRNSDPQSQLNDTIQFPSPCQGSLGNEWWYVQMLINQAKTSSITINTGPKIVVPNTIGAGVGTGGGSAGSSGGAGGVGSAGSSSGGTALLVVGGLLAAGAGGVYLYGRSHGMTFGQTVRSGWDHVRHPRRLAGRSKR